MSVRELALNTVAAIIAFVGVMAFLILLFAFGPGQ
jgi:hypothetical protein